MVPADGWCLIHAVLVADAFEEAASGRAGFAEHWRGSHDQASGFATSAAKRAAEMAQVMSVVAEATRLIEEEARRPGLAWETAQALLQSRQAANWGTLELPFLLAVLPVPRSAAPPSRPACRSLSCSSERALPCHRAQPLPGHRRTIMLYDDTSNNSSGPVEVEPHSRPGCQRMRAGLLLGSLSSGAPHWWPRLPKDAFP